MNYELARALKDAGFPQSGPPNKFLWQATDNPRVMENGVYVPTLEELIEALPDHCGVQREDFGWCVYVKGFLRDDTISPTPTEAVARLWLALNKKV